MRPSLLAFTALTALALGGTATARAQLQEHRERDREPAAAPAPPAPAAPRPAPPPRLSPGPGPQGAPFAPRAQFQRPPAFEGARPEFARPQFPQGDPRARLGREDRARPGAADPSGSPDRYAGIPGHALGQMQPGIRAPGYERGTRYQPKPGDAARPGYGDRHGFYGGSQPGVRPPNDPHAGVAVDGAHRSDGRAGYDRNPQIYGQRRGIAAGLDGTPRPHFDARREYGGEKGEWRRVGGFHGDFEDHRHDRLYRDWHRDDDRDRLVIINRYGYSPWGYGFRPGWNDYGRSYWGNNIGWGFDLRFGYWYGPSYYDPGFDWWYGPRAPYEYGVRAEELILRDTTLHNWALNYFDYNRDGYLDRDEIRAAARALRQIADFNGDGWIQSSEYRSAVDRLGGGAYAYQQAPAYDTGAGFEPGYDAPPPPEDDRPY